MPQCKTGLSELTELTEFDRIDGCHSSGAGGPLEGLHHYSPGTSLPFLFHQGPLEASHCMVGPSEEFHQRPPTRDP